MKYILAVITLLLTLTTHWHHKEQTRVREYVYLRADQETSVDNAVMQASEHFDMSIEDVQAILYKADMRGIMSKPITPQRVSKVITAVLNSPNRSTQRGCIMDEITEVKIFIDKQGRRMNKDNLPKVHIHDFVTYTGEKSEYLKQGESYCVKAVSNCPQCGDELLELYGFKDGISHCRFCDAPIFNNCFSRSRFIIQTNAYNTN